MCFCADVSNIQGGQNMANTQILNFYSKSDFDWVFFSTFRLLLKCPDCIFSKIFDQTAFVINGVKRRFENLQFLHISEGDLAKKVELLLSFQAHGTFGEKSNRIELDISLIDLVIYLNTFRDLSAKMY